MTLSSDRLFIVWLVLLLLTGGASHPARLSLLCLPLALALPRVLPLVFIGLLFALPSAVELVLYGQWIGPFGARLRLIAGGLVAASAFGLGLKLKADRQLRDRCVPWIPSACILLAVQAALNAAELLPPSARFLNGNHLAALALLMLAPATAFRLTPKARGIAIGALLIALGISTSRWGGVVGFAAILLLLSRERLKGYTSLVCGISSVSIPPLLWLIRDQIETSKLSIIRSLYPITEIRPWSGIGPEGLERLSLRYLVAYWGRTTHGESLYLDWASSLGIPITIGILFFWIAWCIWRLGIEGEHTAARMCRSSSLVLLFLLIHELIDFSLTSGAVASMAGFLFAWTIPKGSFNHSKTKGLSRWSGCLLTLALPLLAWHFEPLKMEKKGTLETISPPWGEQPYRIPWSEARSTDDPELRIQLLSKALKQAPGDSLLWLDFGDALYQSKRRKQALEAYRYGFSMLQDASRRKRGKALARLLQPDEVWQVLQPHPDTRKPNQISVMIGAAPILIQQGKTGYYILRKAEITFANDELSRFYVRSLDRTGLHPDLVTAETLRLLRRSPPTLSAAPLLIKNIKENRGQKVALDTLLALSKAIPDAGCRALGRWSLDHIDLLIDHRQTLLSKCSHLPSKDLHTENILSRIPRPIP